MSGILNNFMANLQPIPSGSFNPVLDSKYADIGGLEMLNQSRDAIARSKVDDMIRQAQLEGRDLNQYEAGLISRVSPNATAGYNNNLTTQSTLKSNEIAQNVKKQELENQWIVDTARILKSSDPAIKEDVYKRQIQKAIDMGIQDETDPTEYSPETENQLIKYSEAMLQEQRDARSYGSPASLQSYAKLKELKDKGDQTGDYTDYNLFRDTLKLDDKGLQIVDGKTVVKPNYDTALATINSTVKGAEANAQLPAKQAEQNMRVNAEQEIITGKNTAELNQIDAKKIQQLTQDLPIAENVTAQSISGIDDTISKLEQAKSKVGSNTAGWEGLLKIMPVSDYNDLKVQLKTLNSRFGLDSLLKLKSQGGTLGQVAVKEFEALQDSISNLTQAQRPEQLKQNMDDAIRQLRVAQDSIERAFQAEYGRVLGQSQGQGQQPQTQQSNQTQERIRTYNLQTGNFE